MIANIKEFEKKLIDKELNRRKLAEMVALSPSTLTCKLDSPERDFKMRELVQIANLLNLTKEEFLYIFFGEKLSFNERYDKQTA